MGRHTYQPAPLSRVRGMVKLNVKVDIVAAGVPTLQRAHAITSIVRNGAGNYTITLLEKFKKIMGLNVMQIAVIQDMRFQILSETVAANGEFVLSCQVGGVETDPVNPSTLLIDVLVQDTDVEL